MIDLDLEGAPETDEQREAWRIHSDREASWALRKLATAIAETERLTRDAADETAAIGAWLEAALAGPDRDRMFFEAALIRYRLELEERDPDLPKTYKLPGGTIARRKGRDTYHVTDEAAFVAWALDNDPNLVKVEPRVSGLRDYLPVATEHDTADTRTLATADGDLVPGVEYVVGEDGYSAKPG